MDDWLRRHPVLWRVGLALTAAGLGASALVLFALGSCHDSGGFCASEFDETHVESYVSAAVLATLAAPAAAATASRRPVVLAMAALLGGGLVGLLAALYESGA